MRKNRFRLKAVGIAAVSSALLLMTACGSEPDSGSGKRWTDPPQMMINADKAYTANVKTNKGDFVIELFPEDAPKAVNNFVFLAKENFYNGVVFHRIIETFMVQTGDPDGNGTGGPGYSFEIEPNNKYSYDQGIVAMANSGLPNSNGSQFFIVTGDASHLNRSPNYTVFGKVTEGMDTVMSIAKTPVKLNPVSNNMETPTEKVTIDFIQIVEK